MNVTHSHLYDFLMGCSLTMVSSLSYCLMNLSASSTTVDSTSPNVLASPKVSSVSESDARLLAGDLFLFFLSPRDVGSQALGSQSSGLRHEEEFLMITAAKLLLPVLVAAKSGMMESFDG